MIAAFEKGDVDGPGSSTRRLLESYDFETGDATPNPVPPRR